jgi:trigger factor
MQVSIEASEGLNRQLKVTIPAADYQNAEKAQIREYSKHRRFPGFRPGHVPDARIVKEYGNEIKQHVIQTLINSSVFASVQQAKIENLANSYPRISNVQDNGSASDLVYTVDVEVNPEISFDKDLSEVEVTRVVSKVTDEDLDKMIDTLRNQQVKWNEVQRAAAKGDLVNVDFEGFIDGVAFEHGAAKGYAIKLGDNRMIPGFEDQIVGHSANDEFDINVTFPAEYQNKDLAGKAVTFKAKVNKVSEPVLPELNEDFIKMLGVTGGVDELKAEVRKNMERELEMSVEGVNANEVFAKLLENYGNVELPPFLLKETAQAVKSRAQQNKRGEMPEEVATAQATTEIKNSLIVDKLCAKFDLKMDPTRVDKYIDAISAAYENSEEYKKAIKGNKQQMMSISQRCFVQQIVDFVLSKAKVTDKESNFFELVNNRY